MIVHNFILTDCDGKLAMTTQLDEPNPMIDTEFWALFLEGWCEMTYTGTEEETENA